MTNLKELTLYFIAALILLTFLVCSRSQGSTLQEIKKAEAEWKMNPVSDYRIVVEVERQDDRRRNEIIVEEGKVSHAFVSYWNSDEKKWEGERPLNQQQALPFTVPGLFETVREEIANSGRQDIRVSMKGHPPIPSSIILGALFQNGEPLDVSRTLVFVSAFEPL